MADVADDNKRVNVHEVLPAGRGICVVFLVASMPIAVQVVCTSAITLRSCTLAEKQAIVSRLACASINPLQRTRCVLTRQQNKRARTKTS